MQTLCGYLYCIRPDLLSAGAVPGHQLTLQSGSVAYETSIETGSLMQGSPVLS